MEDVIFKCPTMGFETDIQLNNVKSEKDRDDRCKAIRTSLHELAVRYNIKFMKFLDHRNIKD